MQDFDAWKDTLNQWLDAEDAGEHPDIEFADPVALEQESFSGLSAFSPAAMIGTRMAYNTIQAHRRDVQEMAKQRSTYYSEMTNEVSMTKEYLEQLKAVLERLGSFLPE